MEEQGSPRRARMFAIGVVLGCAASGLIVAMESWEQFSWNTVLLFPMLGFLVAFAGKKDREKKPRFFAADLSGYLLGVTVVALLAHWKLGARYGFIVFALEVPFVFGIWLREEIDSRRQNGAALLKK